MLSPDFIQRLTQAFFIQNSFPPDFIQALLGLNSHWNSNQTHFALLFNFHSKVEANHFHSKATIRSWDFIQRLTQAFFIKNSFPPDVTQALLGLHSHWNSNQTHFALLVKFHSKVEANHFHLKATIRSWDFIQRLTQAFFIQNSAPPDFIQASLGLNSHWNSNQNYFVLIFKFQSKVDANHFRSNATIRSLGFHSKVDASIFHSKLIPSGFHSSLARFKVPLTLQSNLLRTFIQISFKG